MGLGSGIQKKTYSGSRIRVQGQKGNGSRIRNTGVKYYLFVPGINSKVRKASPQVVLVDA